MIVRVIPLRRMPRGIDILDYAVPSELQDLVTEGQLVTIPLRKSQIHGIVLSFKEPDLRHNEHALKPILTIVQNQPIISKPYMHVWRILASWYGVSLGVIAKMALLPLQKRKLKQAIFKEFVHTRYTDPITEVIHYQNNGLHQHAIQEKISTTGQTLIVVPTISLIEEVANLLTDQQKEQAVTWYGELSEKEKFARWLHIRNGEKNIIIGTRTAVLLPYYNLKRILIDYEHDEQHKHWDGSPKFHVKDVAALLQKIFAVDISLMSYSLSVDAYQKTDSKAEHIDDTRHAPTVIDISGQRAVHDYSPFSLQVENLIQNVKSDIVLLLNRRGFARSFTCMDCGFVHACDSCHIPYVYHEKRNELRCHYCNSTTSINTTCPSCSSTMMKLRGIGTEFIEAEAAKILPPTHTLVRVDADTPLPDLSPDINYIVVGTYAALKSIRWQKAEAVVMLDIDRELAMPEYTTEEHLFHLLQGLAFRASAHTRMLIQTRNPDHLLFSWLAHPPIFYEQTLKTRTSLAFPPATYLVRYMVGHPFVYDAKAQADDLVLRLNGLLTNSEKNISIQGPLEMHPRYYRGRHWYVILVKLQHESWMNDLLWLNKYIPRGWHIDPRPNSILTF